MIFAKVNPLHRRCEDVSCLTRSLSDHPAKTFRDVAHTIAPIFELSLQSHFSTNHIPNHHLSLLYITTYLFEEHPTVSEISRNQPLWYARPPSRLNPPTVRPANTRPPQSDGEEAPLSPPAAAEEVDVAADAGAASGQMSVIDALKGVLKLALIHDGLARGLREASKALDRRQAHMCVLNEACEEEAYKKLVVALCGEHKIPLIKVPDGKQLGEWAGLCEYSLSWMPQWRVLLFWRENESDQRQ